MCQWGANRNPGAGYRPPTFPLTSKPEGRKAPFEIAAKSATTYGAHHGGGVVKRPESDHQCGDDLAFRVNRGAVITQMLKYLSPIEDVSNGLCVTDLSKK